MPAPSDVVIRRLREQDLDEADRIMRLAFGTFLGLSDPTKTFEDREVIRNRWRASPSSVFAAVMDGKLVGSNVLTRWGSFGFFGPLTVRPDLWDRGIARMLLQSTMELFSEWQTTHTALYTFAESPKHVGLYHKYGFCARFLTVVMSKEVGQPPGEEAPQGYLRFSKLNEEERRRALGACKELANMIYEGLDLTSEMLAVTDQKLGDTIMVMEGSEVRGFAVCHVGSGTEAGGERCYVKFGAARPGSSSRRVFQSLLRACESFAEESGATEIEAGVNLGRSDAYDVMLKHGFRTEFQGVVMDRPNEAGYNRPDVYAIDDLR